ncbi:MAG TPA: hypothetical protein VIX19_02370, partial [Terriglobales bacterium]
MSRTGGVATITATNSFINNEWVRISGVVPDISFNGVWQLSGTGGSSFTVKQPNLPNSSPSSIGSPVVTGPVPNGPSVLVTTITSVDSGGGGVMLNTPLPKPITNNTATWAHDD